MRKPEEFTSLAACVETTFRALRESFPELRTVLVDVSQLEHPEPALDDLDAIVVFTLRRLQGLHRCTQPGLQTTGDVVIGLVAEIDRALNEILASAASAADMDLIDALGRFADEASSAVRSLMKAVEQDPLVPLR